MEIQHLKRKYKLSPHLAPSTLASPFHFLLMQGTAFIAMGEQQHINSAELHLPSCALPVPSPWTAEADRHPEPFVLWGMALCIAVIPIAWNIAWPSPGAKQTFLLPSPGAEKKKKNQAEKKKKKNLSKIVAGNLSIAIN